jgi:hypothetical protein
MNYLAIIALSLGLISIMISLKVFQQYQSIDKSLIKIRSLCSKTPNDVPMNKEPFADYELTSNDWIYMNANQRRVDVNKSLIAPDKMWEDKQIHTISEYQEDIQEAKEHIRFNDIQNNYKLVDNALPNPVDKKEWDNLVKQAGQCGTNGLTYPDVFKDICRYKINGKNFCFRVPMRSLCQSNDFVKSMEDC